MVKKASGKIMNPYTDVWKSLYTHDFCRGSCEEKQTTDPSYYFSPDSRKVYSVNGTKDKSRPKATEAMHGL